VRPTGYDTKESEKERFFYQDYNYNYKEKRTGNKKENHL